jgi:ribonuclease P protein component
METLFGSGSKSMAAYPLRVVYKMVGREETSVPVQVLISVSKKHLRHAVDRNRVKRQVREAYRLHKEELSGKVTDSASLLLAFIWVADELAPTSKVEDRVVRLLTRISEKI